MEKLTQENFNEKTNDGLVLVDFFATWCGPCRMIHPVLENLENSRSEIKIVQVDVDEAPDLSKEYGVMSIPTLVLMKNGKEIAKKVGFQSASELNEWIEENKD